MWWKPEYSLGCAGLCVFLAMLATDGRAMGMDFGFALMNLLFYFVLRSLKNDEV